MATPGDTLDPVRLAAYRRWGARMIGRRREDALRILREWRAEAEHPYVSISGGKDSTALVAMAREVDPEMPLVHVCSALCTPQCCRQVDALAEWSGMRLLRAEPDEDPWAWIAAFEGDITTQANDASSELDEVFFFRPLRAIREREGFDAAAIGLRAEESRNRRLNLAIHGDHYVRKDGLRVATPLARWQTMDVYGLICAEEMPIAEVYGWTGLIDDHLLREGWWLPGLTAKYGVAVLYKKHLPQIWRRLTALRPELSALA